MPKKLNQKTMQVDWLGFRLWLKAKNYRGHFDSTIYCYAKRYADCLLDGNLSPVLAVPETNRPNIVKALSSLSKFLGVHREFLELKTEYGLKWTGRDLDSLIIERITRTTDLKDLQKWSRTVMETFPQFEGLMRLLWTTGLRFGEAVLSHDLIVLDRPNYYRNGVLEHFRFRDLFLRRTKKAYLSFCPSVLVNEICIGKRVGSVHVVSGYLKKRGVPQRFSEVREAWATLMSKYLSQTEIDFLQGRVGASVFMRHYYNPLLMKDLRKRVLKGMGGETQ